MNKKEEILEELFELALNEDIRGNDLRLAILLSLDSSLTKSQMCNILGWNVTNIYPALKRLESSGFQL